MKPINTTPTVAVLIFLAVLVGAGIVTSPTLFAQDSKGSPPILDPDSIKDTRNQDQAYEEKSESESGEPPLPDNYPDHFDVVGPLSDLREGEVVIGETAVSLSKSVNYFDSNGDALFKSYFKSGVLVGIVVNQNQEVEQIWRLQKK